jgi:hypothetical protein
MLHPWVHRIRELDCRIAQRYPAPPSLKSVSSLIAPQTSTRTAIACSGVDPVSPGELFKLAPGSRFELAEDPTMERLEFGRESTRRAAICRRRRRPRGAECRRWTRCGGEMFNEAFFRLLGPAWKVLEMSERLEKWSGHS